MDFLGSRAVGSAFLYLQAIVNSFLRVRTGSPLLFEFQIFFKS
jgi:hypothetical protein